MDYASKFYVGDKNDKNNIEYVQKEIYDKLYQYAIHIDFLMQVKY